MGKTTNDPSIRAFDDGMRVEGMKKYRRGAYVPKYRLIGEKPLSGTKITDDGTPSSLRILMSAGFRVFFLFAGGFAVFCMAAWLAWLGIHAMNGMIREPSIAVAPHLWHGHELIFGYSCAVLAGFLTTAVPNWTGRPAPSAATISTLAAFWLAGRAAVWFSAFLPSFVVAAADMAFLLALAVWTATMLAQDPKPRNVIFVALILALAAGNLLVHLDWMEITGGMSSQGLRFGILVLAVMITIIGGRIVPAFTRNALMRAGAGDNLPVSHPLVDRIAILSTVVTALLSVFEAPEIATGIAALVAAAANGIRFLGWRWQATLRDPIVWSLHLGFLMLVIGYGLLGSALVFGIPDEIAAIHFLAVGAVGVMTLAVMSRAALGHAGRPLVVSTPMTLAYIAIAFAALIRSIGLSMFPDYYYPVIFVSGGLWMIGFGLFTAVYLPILSQPRGA